MVTLGAVLGSAAVHGVVGAAVGTVAGVREGLARSQPRSASHAALTLVSMGTVGLVEWPAILAVSGTGTVILALGKLPAELKRRASGRPASCPPVHHRAGEIVSPDNGSS